MFFLFEFKDDFRGLFQASDHLKLEYRTLQEEYKKVRSEVGELKINAVKLKNDLVTSHEKITALELEKTKLGNKCEVLIRSNNILEEDRRSLMDQVSLLLSQYHELLTHALEDKEYYHSEEKVYV